MIPGPSDRIVIAWEDRTASQTLCGARSSCAPQTLCVFTYRPGAFRQLRTSDSGSACARAQSLRQVPAMATLAEVLAELARGNSSSLDPELGIPNFRTTTFESKT